MSYQYSDQYQAKGTQRRRIAERKYNEQLEELVMKRKRERQERLERWARAHEAEGERNRLSAAWGK